MVESKKLKIGIVIVVLCSVVMLMFGMSPNEYHEKHFDSKEELQVFLPNYYFFELDLQNIEQATFTATSRDLARGCASVSIENINWTGYIINIRVATSNNGELRFIVDANSISGHESTNFSIADVEGFLTYTGTSVGFSFHEEGVWYAFSMSRGLFTSDEYGKELFLSIIEPAIIGRQKGSSAILP